VVTGSVSDEILLRRYSEEADGAAFDELVRRHSGAAAAVARGQLGACAHLAEDAVQESFMRVLRHCGRFDASRSFAAWFHTILRHICCDLRRQRARQHALLLRVANDPSAGASVTSRATPAEDDLLARLAPADGEILAARLVNDMSFAAIAARLGCSEETARKRAQRALRRLRRAVGENY